MKGNATYIGLDVSDKGVYTCTSSGHLRLTPNKTNTSTDELPESDSIKASLPMRLHALQLSPNQKSFAYGGDEVDLSLWDAERAFASSSASSTEATSDETKKKRKKPSAGDALLPGETWRAKNIPNDNLGLRQPIHVASLTFLHPPTAASSPSSTSSSAPNYHIVTGSRYGHLRRYDTRAARKPVSNWKNFKAIHKVQQGCGEHEIIVSDAQSGLYVVDARNGKISGGYKALSGAVNSIATTQPSSASSTQRFATVALDRFFRLHISHPPNAKIEKRSEAEKTPVKVFMKSTPTVVVWDGIPDAVSEDRAASESGTDDEEEEEDEDWDGMDVVDEGEGAGSDDDGEDEEEERPAVRRKRG